jgi:hypothetical protein
LRAEHHQLRSRHRRGNMPPVACRTRRPAR